MNPRHPTIRRPRQDAAPAPTAPVEATAEVAASPPASPAPAPVTPPAPPPPRPVAERLVAEPAVTVDLLAELDALGPDGLAALMRGNINRTPGVGDQVRGTVVRVTSDTVFIDIGGKAEAAMDRGEFDEAGPGPGEAITAYVLGVGDGGVRLARRLTGRAGRGVLEDARDSEIPIEGRVESRNSGGFVVRVAGAAAFCPVSQIDRLPGEDLDRFIGLTDLFLVTDLRGKDVVVSRRAIQEQNLAEEAAKLWATLQPGDACNGTVTGSKEFGVFVDVGGIQGLVPKSELGWDAGTTPPARGAAVSVRVLEINRETKRLTLSLRDPSIGPWSRVGKDFVAGEVYPARITRLAAFGAFAQLAPGLEGLIHISNLAEGRVEQAAHVVKPGQEVRVRLMSVDLEKQRLELGIKQAADGYEPQEAPPSRGGGPRPSASLGTMADLFAGIQVKPKAPPPAGTRRR